MGRGASPSAPPAGTTRVPAAPDRLRSFPSFEEFAAVTRQSLYAPLPGQWVVGATDVVRSTDAIAEGRYKAVNMAGAAAISALMNALHTRRFPFAFAGDGCVFALPGEDAATARAALAATAAFVRDELGLELRAALVDVAAVRAAGGDVRVALFRPAPHVAYAMFDGGGIAMIEAWMKAGLHRVAPGPPGTRPNLFGLACRWLPIRARNGTILSIIVRPGQGGDAAFRRAVDRLLSVAGEPVKTHPVPPEGPRPALRAPGLTLEARASRPNVPLWLWRAALRAHHLLGYVLFRSGRRVPGFDPTAYRALLSRNADVRKFADGLLFTADCDAATERALCATLDAAEAQGALRFGLHRQPAALMTCIVPSLFDDEHFHFIDGAGGGYTAAARQLDGAG